MSVHWHSAPFPTASTPVRRRPAIARSEPDHAASIQDFHEELLRAVGQFDQLLRGLDSEGVDEVGRKLAGSLVARLDQLLGNAFAGEEQRLFALFQGDVDMQVQQAADTLRVDGDWITGNWRELRPMLDSLARSYCWVDIDALRDAVQLFIALVRDHVDQEAALLARASSAHS